MTAPPRTSRFWRGVWVLALGTSATGAISATLAAVGGTITAPWVVALYAWLVLVWMIVAAWRDPQ